jgi:hypothetical protein
MKIKEEDREYFRFLGWLMVIVVVGIIFIILKG